MRVLTFTSLFPNSASKSLGIFAYQKMACLNRRQGNQVHVVAPVPYALSWLGPSRWRALSTIPRREQIGELTVYHPRYFLVPKVSMPFHGFLMFLGSFLLVRKLHKQIGIECIDAQYVYPDGFAATLIGKLLGIPVVVTAHGTDINLFSTFHLVRPMIRWTLKHSAGALGVSNALVEKMIVLGANRDTSGELGNGVDAELFHPDDRLAARQKLGIPEDAQMVLTVAALIPLKGHRFLITAIAELAARYPRLLLYAIGSGSERHNLEQQMEASGLQDRIKFAGQRPYDELPLWFSAANVSCLVSSREGWPSVLLESLACGTPVVATNVGAVAEILASSDLGIIVQQDSAAIARALAEALDRPWDRTAIVHYARQRTWETVALELEEYLRKFSAKHLVNKKSH